MLIITSAALVLLLFLTQNDLFQYLLFQNASDSALAVFSSVFLLKVAFIIC